MHYAGLTAQKLGNAAEDCICASLNGFNAWVIIFQKASLNGRAVGSVSTGPFLFMYAISAPDKAISSTYMNEMKAVIKPLLHSLGEYFNRIVLVVFIIHLLRQEDMAKGALANFHYVGEIGGTELFGFRYG